MKMMKKLFEIITVVMVMLSFFASCDFFSNDDDNKDSKNDGCNVSCIEIGAIGPGGGIVFYHNHTGFTVTGLGTCYYLEAAPNNQATSVTWSSTDVNVTGAEGAAIGTGKANTDAIITAHFDDTASNNAAKACRDYTGGNKNDWFLPSTEELKEMNRVKTYLGISTGRYWSSTQINNSNAFERDFAGTALQFINPKSLSRNVRAIRAF